MNPDSSTAEHLARMCFEVAATRDTGRWPSRYDWEETRWFGPALREPLSLERVARWFERIIDEVLAERRGLDTQVEAADVVGENAFGREERGGAGPAANRPASLPARRTGPA